MKEFNYTQHYKTDAQNFDYFGERPGATKHDERRVHESIISAVPNKVKYILDVGCGSAWIAENFLEKDKNVFSLDISLTNPSRALKKFPALNHFGINADSSNLPFPDNSFDCVIASEIIEHVIYPDKFIAELFRILKPECGLLISTPYREKIIYTLCIHCNKPTPLHAHLHSFDENNLVSLFIDKNLSKVTWKKFGNKVLIYLRTYIILKYLPFRIWELLDKLANKIYSAPAHILIEYKKK